jgi:hypothetical protein
MHVLSTQSKALCPGLAAQACMHLLDADGVAVNVEVLEALESRHNLHVVAFGGHTNLALDLQRRNSKLRFRCVVRGMHARAGAYDHACMRTRHIHPNTRIVAYISTSLSQDMMVTTQYIVHISHQLMHTQLTCTHAHIRLLTQ